MKHLKLFEEFTSLLQVPHGTNNYWIEVLNKLGYSGISPIAGGYYGFCYLTDESKVVKITFDKGDAVSAHILKNKKNEYLVDYYQSYALHIKSESKKNCFVVEMEYLSDKPDYKKLEQAFKSFDNISKLHMIYPNSYVRDFVKIKKEASLNKVSIDLQNSGNFLIKNGHLCAVDIGYSTLRPDFWEIINKLPVVEI